MSDVQVSEMREALLAVLSTAASMGIDIDQLGDLAAEELLDERALANKTYSLGAVHQLSACLRLVLKPDDSNLS